MTLPEVQIRKTDEAENNLIIGVKSECRSRRVYLICKRILDITLSLVGLVLTAVPMMIISLLIKLESPGPAIYLHHRIGKDGKPLPLLKLARSAIMQTAVM